MVRNGRDLLEIVAAILLGLVSVMTTFGAYQAAAWSGKASDLLSASQQMRDRNLTEFITSQLTMRDDSAKLFAALSLGSELSIYPEREVDLLREQEVILSSASPELAAGWERWVACDFCSDQVPPSSPAYETALFASPMSMQIAGYVADKVADEIEERASWITVAAVVFAIALFLLGVASATGSIRVMATLVVGGALAFTAGTALTLIAVV